MASGGAAVQAFKTALLKALVEDGPIAAIVAARVYDVPLDKAAFPYIWLGPVGSQRLPDDCGVKNWSVRARLYAASTKAGRDQAWALVAAMDALLDDAVLDLPAGMEQSLEIRTVLFGDVVSPVAPTQTFIDLTAQLAA